MPGTWIYRVWIAWSKQFFKSACKENRVKINSNLCKAGVRHQSLSTAVLQSAELSGCKEFLV